MDEQLALLGPSHEGCVLNTLDDLPTLSDVMRILLEVQERLIRVEEANTQAAGVIAKVGQEVMPTIEALMENPMISMLLNKKGKR